MTIDYKKVLSIFNLDFNGFESVKSEAEKGDYEKAFSLVVDHYRTRREPKYLFNRDEAVFLNDESIIEDAEKVMNHDIFSHKFDGPIIWNYNPTAETSRDNEWTWSLYRTIYWQSLARAYMINGDERYVKEFAEQLKSFYEAWPAEAHIQNTEFEIKPPFPGHAWRTIEAGIRIYTTWLPCLEIFRKSPNFDLESWAVFLSSIHDHASFLMGHYSNHNRSSNWLSMESSALLQMGIMFPEISDSKSWLDTGYQRVMHEIMYCFDEDGVHMERTPIYHLVASIAFLQATELCMLNNITVAPYALSVLEKSADFIARLVKPDFSTPMLGDGDRDDLRARKSDTSVYEGMNLSFFTDDLNEMRAYFKHMADLFGRKDFLFLATGGKEGLPPKCNDSLLKDAGIYVSRTGLEKGDSYVMTQMVKLERGERSTHSHNDTAHVELMLSGDDILIDCGRYIYNTSIWKDWRHYFTSVTAHNTLYVDDHTMGAVPGVERVRGVRGILNNFVSNEQYKLIDVSHNGYAFMSDSIFHRRQILMLHSLKSALIVDYVTGLGKEDHDIRFYWNFATENMKGRGNKYSYTAKSGAKYNFSYKSNDSSFSSNLYIGSENPKGGWVSYGYPVRVPTGQVVVSKNGKAGVVMASIITPDSLKYDLKVKDVVKLKLGGLDITLSEKGVSIL